MKDKKYYIVWLSTILLSGLTSKASFGFTIIPAQPGASEFYRRESYYTVDNNDLPSNQCNPNTYLSGYDDEGYFLGADDNSSQLGDGFASSVLGRVSSNGRINLSVKAADGGRRWLTI